MMNYYKYNTKKEKPLTTEELEEEKEISCMDLKDILLFLDRKFRDGGSIEHLVFDDYCLAN